MKKNFQGYSLMELLIYVALFAIVVGVLSGILAIFIRIQSQQIASTSVSQELAFVQNTIQRLVRDSVNIQNSAGAASNTLTLRMASSTLDPTIISSDANGIYLTQGTGTTQTLTTNQVKVSQFQVIKYENPGGHAIVQVDLSLTYNSSQPSQQVTQKLQTAISRVTAATFDSDLLPNADNSYSIGILPYAWKNAAFSGNLTVNGTAAIGGGSAGHVICWKADGKTLGYCSTAPNSSGVCTCN